jgi:hypothetical protein
VILGRPSRRGKRVFLWVARIGPDALEQLLLSIDPLAAVAETQEQLHGRLLKLTPAPCPELEMAWRAAAEATLQAKPGREVQMGPEQFLVLLTCRDEKHQVELLQRFKGEGLECKGLFS